MMRIFTWCLLLCCACSLTACLGLGGGGNGGGGGGGAGGNGGGGGDVRIATNLTQGAQQAPRAEDSAAFATGFPVGPMRSGTGSLTLIDPKNQVFSEFADGDFHKTTDDISPANMWLTAEKDMDTQKVNANLATFIFPHGDQGPNGTFVADDGGDYVFKGTATYGKQTVDGKEIAGQTLLINDRTAGIGLEYATFGAWFYPFSWDGTVTENGVATARKGTQIVYHPFYDTNAGNKVAPAANAAFTGAAHAQFAQYMEDGSSISELRSGTATLNIGAANTSGNLALTFPKAYDIGFNNININNGGAISIDHGNIPTITDNGNTTGICLNSNKIWPSEVELKGQFHGAGSAASEAAGAFAVGFRGDKEVRGAFGVKK